MASENLGDRAGLLAAAALMIDYVLTAAVGISAGVAALISAVPSLQPHTLALCLVILALLAMVNMRGVRDTGAVFMLPTFLFIGTLLDHDGGGGVARGAERTGIRCRWWLRRRHCRRRWSCWGGGCWRRCLRADARR